MKYCPQCAGALHARIVDGVERFACADSECGFVAWDNPVPVVAALVGYRDQFLLARNAQWPGELFSLVTGYLERNELPEEAVVREVWEELGLEAKVKRFIGHYAFRPKNQLIVAFEVEASGELNLGDEIAEVKMLPRAALATYDFGPLVLTADIVKDWSAS